MTYTTLILSHGKDAEYNYEHNSFTLKDGIYTLGDLWLMVEFLENKRKEPLAGRPPALSPTAQPIGAILP